MTTCTRVSSVMRVSGGIVEVNTCEANDVVTVMPNCFPQRYIGNNSRKNTKNRLQANALQAVVKFI